MTKKFEPLKFKTLPGPSDKADLCYGSRRIAHQIAGPHIAKFIRDACNAYAQAHPELAKALIHENLVKDMQ